MKFCTDLHDTNIEDSPIEMWSSSNIRCFNLKIWQFSSVSGMLSQIVDHFQNENSFVEWLIVKACQWPLARYTFECSNLTILPLNISGRSWWITNLKMNYNLHAYSIHCSYRCNNSCHILYRCRSINQKFRMKQFHRPFAI